MQCHVYLLFFFFANHFTRMNLIYFYHRCTKLLLKFSRLKMMQKAFVAILFLKKTTNEFWLNCLYYASLFFFCMRSLKESAECMENISSVSTHGNTYNEKNQINCVNALICRHILIFFDSRPHIALFSVYSCCDDRISE